MDLRKSNELLIDLHGHASASVKDIAFANKRKKRDTGSVNTSSHSIKVSSDNVAKTQGSAPRDTLKTSGSPYHVSP